MVWKALILLYAIWGMNWIVMKEAVLYFPAVSFVAYRFALGAVILLAVTAWLRLPLPPRRYWPWIAVTGILQTAVMNVMAQISMETLSAGLVAVLNYSMPLWVALMAHFVLQERMTMRKTAGMAVSAAGLLILMNVSSFGHLSAILITLCGAVAWAAASVIMKWQARVAAWSGREDECGLIQYTTWQMVAGAVSLFLYMGLTGSGPIRWTPAAVGYLLYNGVLASAFAFFLWNYILSHMEAGKASMTILAVPIVGVISGVLILGEPMHVSTAVGMVMILSGIYYIIRQK
jgi:drug/metabolite transporter (DMT)-like permease